MLAVAISTMLSRAISYGTIYTAKLLRRGTDIDRPTPIHAFSQLTVADAMHPFPERLGAATGHAGGDGTRRDWTALLGPVTRTRQPQALFANDNLAQALRQLLIYGRDGLPVVATDGHHVRGWLTNQNVLRVVATQLTAAEPAVATGERAAERAVPHAVESDHDPHAELTGYRIVEHTLRDDSAAVGAALGELHWPPGHLPVSIIRNHRLLDADPGQQLSAGDQINILAPTTSTDSSHSDRSCTRPGSGEDEVA
jgi:CIC family chloride channel protein